MTISTPYRFVPLSRLIVLPDWADQVSHDQPFADGLCGELKLRLTAHTRLCVGDEQTPATDQAPGQVHFFRTPDNQFAIPPSSLKGMLRNVLEIASFARFRQVEDQKLGVRDISSSGNFYSVRMCPKSRLAGWMRFDNGRWLIRPCDFSRVHQRHLIEMVNGNENEWNAERNWPASKRYEFLGLNRELRFRREQMKGKRSHEFEAIPDKAGEYTGRIVLTGKPNKEKKFEFVFHGRTEYELTVPPEVMAGFLRIHENSTEWKFWLTRLSAQELSKRVPVFFHADGIAEHARVRSLGLAMMYKLPYTHSLHDAIRHTDKQHVDGKLPDLPELLFGRLGEDDDNSSGLRGRVNIGFAFPDAGQDLQTEWTEACVLNNPKPTFYPAYIRQDGKKGSFRQLMEERSELAGWKRYQAKPEHFPALEPLVERNLKVQTRLDTLPQHTRFSFTVRFHNLRRVELGALLWAIDFGGRNNLRHGLGVGKPYGLGQVSLEVAESNLRPNDESEVVDDRALYLQACRNEFARLMNESLEQAGAEAKWETCGPIKALFEYATPVSQQLGENEYTYLPAPGNYNECKKVQNLTDATETFHRFAGVRPRAGFDTAKPLAWRDGFAVSLADAARAAADAVLAAEKEQEKVEREERLRTSSPEDGLLIELEHFVKAATAENATNSAKDNLAKKLRHAVNLHAQGRFNADQNARLGMLAEQAMTIDNKKIQGPAKKLLQ